MSLILAGSISLDSTFKDTESKNALGRRSYKARANLIGLTTYIHDGKLPAGNIEIKAVIVCLNEEAAQK
jgi:hypothetical protein